MKRTGSTSKKRKRADASRHQLHLFPGSLNVDFQMRGAVSEAISNSGKDRYQITAEISRLTGIEINKHTLDNWSSESRAKSSDALDLNGNKRWGIPAEMIPAFCEVTGDFHPLKILADATNHRLLKSREVVQLELDRVKRNLDRLQQKEKELQQSLQEEGDA